MAACQEVGPEATAEALGVDSAEDLGQLSLSLSLLSISPLSLFSLSFEPLPISDPLRCKYEAVHRSSDPTLMKSLDYYMKRKTDQFNNSINASVSTFALQITFNFSVFPPSLSLTQSLCACWPAQTLPQELPPAYGTVRSQGIHGQYYHVPCSIMLKPCIKQLTYVHNVH